MSNGSPEPSPGSDHQVTQNIRYSHGQLTIQQRAPCDQDIESLPHERAVRNEAFDVREQQQQQQRQATKHEPAQPSIPRALATIPNLQANDKRAFSFFVEHVSPVLAGELDQQFWRERVPQLCHASPMVRSAALVVSSLYESPLGGPSSWSSSANMGTTTPHHQQAFKWYSQSLSEMCIVLQQAHDQDEEQLELALTTCILFASVEFQQLNVSNSIELMKCGFNLMLQRTATVSQNVFIRDTLLPLFLRQTLVLMIHGYPPDGRWLALSRKVLHKRLSSFDSLQDARTQLFILLIEALCIIRDSNDVFRPENVEAEALEAFQIRQRVALQKLATWSTYFDIYLSTWRPDSATKSRAAMLLRIHLLVFTVWLSACADPSEMSYDRFPSQFSDILYNTEAMYNLERDDQRSEDQNFSFEIGVIPALFFVGLKCRIPSFRRRALALMQRGPKQESLFHREVDGWAVKKIIEIEENLPQEDDRVLGATSVPGMLPPEMNRHKRVLIQWEMEGRRSKQLSVSYTMCSTNVAWMRLRPADYQQVCKMREVQIITY